MNQLIEIHLNLLKLMKLIINEINDINEVKVHSSSITKAS